LEIAHELLIGTKIGDLEWPWTALRAFLCYFTEFGSFDGLLRQSGWRSIYI